MSLNFSPSDFEKLKNNQKAEMINKIILSLSDENEAKDIIEKNGENLSTIIVNLLKNPDNSLQSLGLKLVSTFLNSCGNEVPEKTSNSMIMEIVRTLKDSKQTVRTKGLECLQSIENMLSKFNVIDEILKALDKSSDNILKENILSFFMWLIKSQNVEKEHTDKLSQSASKLQSYKYSKVKDKANELIKLIGSPNDAQNKENLQNTAKESKRPMLRQLNDLTHKSHVGSKKLEPKSSLVTTNTNVTDSKSVVSPNSRNLALGTNSYNLKRNSALPLRESSKNMLITTKPQELKLRPITYDKSIAGNSSNNLKVIDTNSSKPTTSPQLQRQCTYNPSTKEALSIVPDDLMKMWEQKIIPETSDWSKVLDILNSINAGMCKTTIDWEIREKMMMNLCGIVDVFWNTHQQQVITEIKKFQTAFITSVKDLRSRIHRTLFVTLSFLSFKIGDHFASTVEALLPHILRMLSSSSLPSTSSACSFIEISINHLKSHGIISIIGSHIKNNQANIIRSKCASFLVMIINKWNCEYLFKKITITEEAVKNVISDKNNEVRSIGCSAFYSFAEIFPFNAKCLFSKLDSNHKKMIKDKCSIEGFFQILGNSSKESQALEINYRVKQLENAENLIIPDKTEDSIENPENSTLIQPNEVTLDPQPDPSINQDSSNIKPDESTESGASPKSINQANTMYGPPGHTPFTTKNFSAASNGDPLGFQDLDQINEVVLGVEIETIIRNLNSKNPQEVSSSLENLSKLFDKKSKISVACIIKIQDSFLQMLEADMGQNLVNLLEVIQLFVVSYSFPSIDWASKLIISLFSLIPHKLGSEIEDKLFRCIRSTQGLMDDEAFFQLLMKYLSNLPSNYDLRANLMFIQFIKHFMTQTQSYSSNSYFPSALTKISLWAVDARYSLLQTDSCELIRILYDINPTLFTSTSLSLGPIQQETLNKMIKSFWTKSPSKPCVEKDDGPSFRPRLVTGITEVHSVLRNKNYPTSSTSLEPGYRDPLEQINTNICILDKSGNREEMISAANIIIDCLDEIKLSDELNLTIATSLVSILSSEEKCQNCETALLSVFTKILKSRTSIPNKFIPTIFNVCIRVTIKETDEETNNVVTEFVTFMAKFIQTPFIISLFYQYLSSQDDKILAVLKILNNFITLKDWNNSSNGIASLIPQLLDMFINSVNATRKYTISCLASIYKAVGVEKFSQHVQHIDEAKKKLLMQYIEA